MERSGRISMRLFAIAILLFFVGHSVFGKVLSLKYDKVIMYDYSGSKDWYLLIIDEKGQLAKTVTKQVQLPSEEADHLQARLKSKTSFGAGTAACFEPHLGFVFYKNNKVVNAVSVCMSCNRLYSNIDLPAQKQGKLGHGKNTYYYLDGMSKSFRLFLSELLVKYRFSNQISPNSAFSK